MNTKSFFTCVVLRIDAFETVIVDEKHFPTMEEAAEFRSTLETGLVCVIAAT